MHYVILRDDDTNALTPPERLEELYRPFLNQNLPVNLAVIPGVRTDARTPEGGREKFLPPGRLDGPPTLPIAESTGLVQYLAENPGFRIVQHGYDHSLFEFDSTNWADVRRRIDVGARLLTEAGFPEPETFVAPYDRFSRISLVEAKRKFDVISTGWFEWSRLPVSWRPRYLLGKLLRQPHLRIGGTTILTHPGCLLSYRNPFGTMLDNVQKAVLSQRVTVLVTHWWEYFRDGTKDQYFINVLHQTASWLAGRKDVRVISFHDLAAGRLPAGKAA